MLRALARRRSLVVAVAFAVALTGFAAPALAWTHGHAVETSVEHYQHHSPALPYVQPLPAPIWLGFAGPPEMAASRPIISTSIFKIPLPV